MGFRGCVALVVCAFYTLILLVFVSLLRSAVAYILGWPEDKAERYTSTPVPPSGSFDSYGEHSWRCRELRPGFRRVPVRKAVGCFNQHTDSRLGPGSTGVRCLVCSEHRL